MQRALIESHAWLVTCFFGMILALAGVEIVAKRHDPGDLFVALAPGSATTG